MWLCQCGKSKEVLGCRVESVRKGWEYDKKNSVGETGQAGVLLSFARRLSGRNRADQTTETAWSDGIC